MKKGLLLSIAALSLFACVPIEPGAYDPYDPMYGGSPDYYPPAAYGEPVYYPPQYRSRIHTTIITTPRMDPTWISSLSTNQAANTLINGTTTEEG